MECVTVDRAGDIVHHGAYAGLAIAQLRGARLHPPFQLLGLLFEGLLTGAELLGHVAEALRQASDFVTAFNIDANRQIARSDFPRSPVQSDDGLGEPSRHQPHARDDQQQRAGDCDHGVPRLLSGKGHGLGLADPCAEAPPACRDGRVEDPLRLIRLPPCEPHVALPARHHPLPQLREVVAAELAAIVQDRPSDEVGLVVENETAALRHDGEVTLVDLSDI